MSKAIAIGYLMKVSAGNVNASHSEGNVIIAKKVTLPDGRSLPYISGQAIRRMLRDRIEDMGWRLSETASKVSGQEVTPPVRPWEFIDEDLFGYLDPSGGHRRTSPVRVSAAIGLFPFQGDRDLGTRSFEKFGRAMEEGGNMFETELYNNVFRGTILVELDRVGVFTALEIGEKRDDVPSDLRAHGDNDQPCWRLSISERQKRVQALLDGLYFLWGGGRTARMLTDLSPRFVAYARLGVKHPVFLEALDASFENGRFRLSIEPLEASLAKFEDSLVTAHFGIDDYFFANAAEISASLASYGHVADIRTTVEKAKEDVRQIWKS